MANETLINVLGRKYARLCRRGGINYDELIGRRIGNLFRDYCHECGDPIRVMKSDLDKINHCRKCG